MAVSPFDVKKSRKGETDHISRIDDIFAVHEKAIDNELNRGVRRYTVTTRKSVMPKLTSMIMRTYEKRGWTVRGWDNSDQGDRFEKDPIINNVLVFLVDTNRLTEYNDV